MFHWPRAIANVFNSGIQIRQIAFWSAPVRCVKRISAISQLDIIQNPVRYQAKTEIEHVQA